MKNVLFVIGSLDKGGAETQLSRLSIALKQNEINVRIFALSSGGALAAKLLENGVSISYGYLNYGNNFISRVILIFISWLKLFFISIKYKPCVIHGFLPLGNFIASTTAFFSRVKCIISKRALGTHQDKNSLWRYIDNTSNYLSNVVTANSLGVLNDALSRECFIKDKIKLVYNGIDLEDYSDSLIQRSKQRKILNLLDEDIAIICIANLIPYKGHIDLLTAFSFICKKNPNVKLFLAGDDRGIQNELTNKSIELNIENNVSFCGIVNDIPQLLSAMDVGILASHEEGFSNAIMEYLSAGLPVVATNVGGNEEILCNAPGCYLCRVRDVENIALTLIRVIDELHSNSFNRELRIGLIKDNYSINTMLKNYLNIYNRL